jgi:alpha-glucuronidase
MKKRSAVRRKKIDFFAGISVFAGVLAALLFSAPASPAQTANQAWLREGGHTARIFFPRDVIALGNGVLERSAVEELKRNLGTLSTAASLTARVQAAIGGKTVIGTAQEVRKAFPDLAVPSDLGPDAFWIYSAPCGDTYNGCGEHNLLVIAGGDERGALYGAFALLRLPATEKMGELHSANPWRGQPSMPIRWVDEWDNPNGTIERGYGGPSIFFENGHVRDDLAPVAQYARLLASVGIDGCNVNNVNGAAPFLTDEWLQGLARIANTMRPWGVRLAISVDIASPQKAGGLATFDPLDPQVKAWWAAKTDQIYRLIPDFAGFTVKADSEGQAGPASYGRSPADAANVLANALAPHGGVVLYRAFVYNNHLDYNNLKADRARAAYDIFHPLDGKFAANVVVQIKYGPIDFQAREPVSPLFAGLRKTSEAMELQITQEYTGQQRHLVYLAPMWKQVLDFDLRADNRSAPVKEIIEGKSFNQPLGGVIGVACVGQDDWLGSPLALANLYAFGRLAWDPNLSAEQIAAEWTRQSISTDPDVVGTISHMLMESWPAYEHYTGPLGTQTLTAITGSHYGPNIESSERNGWGQWHRDDHRDIGMDRTVATGTGYIGQYPPEVAKMYESLATCPDNLLLFFHHVPYTYKLHSGQTVIQYFYDSHYQGAAEAAKFVDEWDSLKGKIDPALFNDVHARLVYQAGHAIVWRDAIVQYFLKQSGIPDEKGRAGHFPGRLEAEDARLTGYKVISIDPWEDASRGKAVSCIPNSRRQTCTAEWTYKGAAGRYNIAVQYFDLQGGAAKFTLAVNGQPAAQWTADALFPSRVPNGDNSTRYTARGIELKPGDTLSVEGRPDGSDPAALDYIEIQPASNAAD